MPRTNWGHVHGRRYQVQKSLHVGSGWRTDSGKRLQFIAARFHRHEQLANQRYALPVHLLRY